MIDSNLLDGFEKALKMYLNSVVEDMSNKQPLNSYDTINLWHEHNEKIRDKAFELVYKLIENHNIDQAHLKDSDKPLYAKLLFVSHDRVKDIINEVFNYEIKPIIYKSFDQDGI